MSQAYGLRAEGRDVHRVYFIGYTDGGTTLVANTRDETSLAGWVEANVGIKGIDRAGVYHLGESGWEFAAELASAGSRPARKRRVVLKTPQFDAAARQHLIDIVRSSENGIRSGDVWDQWSASDPKRYPRKMHRYLNSLCRLRVIEKHREGLSVTYRASR